MRPARLPLKQQTLPWSALARHMASVILGTGTSVSDRWDAQTHRASLSTGAQSAQMQGLAGHASELVALGAASVHTQHPHPSAHITLAPQDLCGPSFGLTPLPVASFPVPLPSSVLVLPAMTSQLECLPTHPHCRAIIFL